MKTLKNSILAITAIALIATATSCKKTVTPKKLDGEWKMTSGKVVDTYVDNDANIYVETTTYSGETRSTVETENGIPEAAEPATPYTMTISFDKKAGTYEQVVVSTYSYTDNIDTYKKDANGMETDQLNVDQKTVRVSTTTEKGVFTITGGTGEIEKNSQFVLRANDSESNVTYTYTYFDGATAVSPTGRYTRDGWFGSEEELKATKSEIIVETGHNSFEGTIYTVDELKKGVMDVSGSYSSTRTVGATTTTDKIEFNWTLTEQ
ncbi:MAG: hypothetical protein M3Q58_00955 [Bacteroidota bacterium]|nr:hypothetical protein [Bacteroidota bacterium]